LAASQESIPAVASVPANVTVTVDLFQPLALGWGLEVAVAAGAVASYLSARESVSEFPALSRHAPSTEAAAVSGPE
jgi:hypothetical protein